MGEHRPGRTIRAVQPAPVDRTRRDSCPGALTVHEAADGGLARIRIPGGFVTARQLRTIAAAAREIGNGIVELTSRGNLQLRGIPAGAERDLGDRLAAAGLLPSETHELVRNVVASPLAGLDSPVDVAPVVHDLDDALRASPSLADLPGRFLFAVDDGRGDVAALGADATAVLTSGGAIVEGFAVPAAVTGLLAVAEAFLAERAAQGSAAWRMDELEGGRHSALARASLGAWLGPTPSTPAPPAPVGRVRQLDGRTALVVLAPLGRLTSGQLELLATCTGTRARVTPWRSVVLPDLDDAAAVSASAAAAGLGVDAGSRWYGVSACTGRPGCAKALADVQADAAAAVHRWPEQVVHWSGCERHCGRPKNTTIDIVATSEGYSVAD